MRKIFLFVALVILAQVATNVSVAQTKSGMSDKEIFANAYILKDNEKKIARDAEYMMNDIHPVLYSIERYRDSTKVTFIQPLYFDSQWLHYGRGYTIVDRATGKEYPVINYGEGLPIDRLLIVRGCNRKSIYISLIFPKLPRSVKVIDLEERPSPFDQLPSNNAPGMEVRPNIRISDYNIKKIAKYEKRRKIKEFR